LTDPLDLPSVFDACFHEVASLVESRQAVTNYDWLIQHNIDYFYPDYFTVGTLGRNAMERCFNVFTAGRFGQLSLSYKVVSRFVDLFYDLPLFCHAPHRQWLLDRLRTMPKHMIQWSLVEFFLFMEKWLAHMLSRDFMMFSSQKDALNKVVLPVICDVDVLDVSDDAVTRAVHAACYANWLDIIVPDYEKKIPSILAEIQGILSGANVPCLGNDMMTMLNGGPKRIVYECDNAGEIILDLMVVIKLILKGHRIVMVGKAQSILNDVTVDDIHQLIQSNSEFLTLQQALISGQLRVISANDFPIVGKFIPLANQAYKQAAINCDMFWLKGQANFQTMPMVNHGVFKSRIKYNKPIMFNFIVKTPIVRYCLDHSNIGDVILGNPLIMLV